MAGYSDPTSGPLIRKLLRAIRRQRSNKVVDLNAYRTAGSEAEALQESMVSPEALAELHPSHAIYVHAQNVISLIAEHLTSLPEVSRLADIVEAAEEEYMPSGPPISPLTGSYFTCWALFDAGVGLRKETLGTCVLAVGQELGMDSSLLETIRRIDGSRMGIYVHAGLQDGYVRLRELMTGDEHCCIQPSGYNGETGELWYVRLLPPPFDPSGCSVAFTTPYVLQGHSEEEWLAYFDRALGAQRDRRAAYGKLMKYGKSFNYWNEFVFESYSNFVPEAVFLQGLPDIAATRPHSGLPD